MKRIPTWSLWLGAAVAVAVALVAVSGDLVDRGPSEEPAPTVQAPPEQAPRVDTGEVSGRWRPVAARFGRDFVNLDGGRGAWLRRLKATVSPSLVQGYRATDVRLVPVAEFLKVSVEEDLSSDDQPRVVALLHYTNELTIRTVLEPVGGRWSVTSAEPADDRLADGGSEA